MTPRDFIDVKFASKLKENPACMKDAGVRSKKIGLDIEGSSGGQWMFAFDDQGSLTIQSSQSDANADCMISMKEDVFVGMLTGKVNVPMAFVMRKIKVKGESSLAAKLGMSLQQLFKA